MNKNECQGHLDWLAFCYLSGEMTPAETQQFEAQLADEQSAREALARAVELTQVVAAAESQCDDLVAPASRRSATWSTRLAWMAVGGLASLVIGMLWTSYQSGGWITSPRAGEALNSALAVAWSQTRDDLRDSGDIGPLHPISAAASEPADELFAVVEDAPNEPLFVEAPSWMTAAVAGLADEMMDELPEDPNQS